MTELSRIESALEPVVADHGMEIVDVELASERGGRVLRLFVDWPDGGVTLEDCARVSRDCSALLDAEDLVAGQYRLEVSSPGVERRLRKREHFERQVGRRVHAVLREPLEGRKRFTGTLKRVRDDAIELELPEGGEAEVPLAAIKRANLKVF
jgi:ribosome maturation factor RimP